MQTFGNAKSKKSRQQNPNITRAEKNNTYQSWEHYMLNEGRREKIKLSEAKQTNHERKTSKENVEQPNKDVPNLTFPSVCFKCIDLIRPASWAWTRFTVLTNLSVHIHAVAWPYERKVLSIFKLSFSGNSSSSSSSSWYVIVVEIVWYPTRHNNKKKISILITKAL